MVSEAPCTWGPGIAQNLPRSGGDDGSPSTGTSRSWAIIAQVVFLALVLIVLALILRNVVSGFSGSGSPPTSGFSANGRASNLRGPDPLHGR